MAKYYDKKMKSSFHKMLDGTPNFHRIYDKEITKKQVYQWKPNNIKKLIYKLCEIELLIKKNINNSIHLITDFTLEQSTLDTNN